MSQFKDSLLEQVERLFIEKKITLSDPLKIKLSGDGINVGNRLQLLNVTYSIISKSIKRRNQRRKKTIY